MIQRMSILMNSLQSNPSFDTVSWMIRSILNNFTLAHTAYRISLTTTRTFNRIFLQKKQLKDICKIFKTIFLPKQTKISSLILINDDGLL